MIVNNMSIQISQELWAISETNVSSLYLIQNNIYLKTYLTSLCIQEEIIKNVNFSGV